MLHNVRAEEIAFEWHCDSGPPTPIYEHLAAEGFDVAWSYLAQMRYDTEWISEEPSEHVFMWTPKPGMEFAYSWTTLEKPRQQEEQRKLQRRHEILMRQVWDKQRWIDWFDNHPGDWKAFFPGHDQGKWKAKIEGEIHGLLDQ